MSKYAYGAKSRAFDGEIIVEWNEIYNLEKERWEEVEITKIILKIDNVDVKVNAVLLEFDELEKLYKLLGFLKEEVNDE